ncbi:NAD(P)-dependent oxidoreductase [Secundilactobacillus hailunensis]|uniref:NAD(P)-dependent oxidoreductase n=1 Tax=Secundilactobacillus hailunensis TaxID=2559923 RepID=A0ABW1T8S4_9LACO|nr:NAD(P)H-binding protein [Secundilactobacillus hailunensis]
MKIGIIGATGNVGQVVTREALNRGHEVSAIVRNAEKAKNLLGDDVTIVEKDAMALTRDDLTDYDVVVDAFASTKPYLHVDLAARLVSFFRDDDQTRLAFIIGASILHNETGETLLADTLKQYAGEPWLDGMIQQDHEYDFIQWVDNVDWTVITPSTEFADGPKTAYKLGGDQVITSAAGKAEVSFANFAAALIDEIETPKHTRQQFAVVDA